MDSVSAIASSCLGCPSPRCATFCPCGNAIRDILALVKQGDLDGAAKKLYETNPFPEWTAPLCDHQRQCRGHCIRGIKGVAVDFPSVELALASVLPFPYKPGPENGKKVLIVGAGPAGCSAAVFLRQGGFAVKIVDKQGSIGGAIRSGIPSFRFDKKILPVIQSRLENLGCELSLGVNFDLATLEQTKKTFDYVLLACGAEKENRLSLPLCPDVFTSLPLLEELNQRGDISSLKEKENIIVMGGGNVAMDISRSLKRLGKQVTLIYRRDVASMPAAKDEIEEAIDEGVVFSPLTNLSSLLQDESGRLLGLRLVKMELGEPDESGRPSFKTIEESEFDVTCDAFVTAIGEKSFIDPSIEDGKQVFLIGDCRYGAKNIASAIKDGREKAQQIIESK